MRATIIIVNLVFLACSVAVVAPYVGFFLTAIYGLLGLGVGVMLPYFMKVSKRKKNEDDWMLLYPYALLILLALYVFYSSAIVFLYGIEGQGTITSKRYTVDLQVTGEGMAVPVTTYYCHVDTYGDEMICGKNYEVNETIYYLYSPRVTGRPPFISKTKREWREWIVSELGHAFVMFGNLLGGLLCTWFVTLHWRGRTSLETKLTEAGDLVYKIGEMSTLRQRNLQVEIGLRKLCFIGLYALSYTTFIFFIFSIFKHFIIMVHSQFWLVALTSVVFIVILFTSLFERLFEYSSQFILETRTFLLLDLAKLLWKLVTFGSFLALLLHFLTAHDKTIFEICSEFIKTYLDIDLDQVWDWIRGGAKSGTESAGTVEQL